MKSYSTLKTMFKTLSQNTSTANDSLADILLNDQHRYLLLRFFDNERTFSITTVGPLQLTLTAAPSAGDKSATLTSAWTHPSCQQFVLFSNGEQRTGYFVQGSANITWQAALGSAATTAISTPGLQSYPLPVNVSKIKNGTITVGQLVYSPAPVQSIQEWTKLNALPYSSEIPAYFFVYNGQINFWPIPSTTGDVITLNCQVAIPDMTYADYTTGTISTMSVDSNAIVLSGSTLSTTFPTGTDVSFVNLYFTATPPNGDGYHYPIQSITDNTHIVLAKPVVYAPNVAGGAYTIGQYPLLTGDFHDAIVYGALRIYFSSIVKDPTRYQLYNGLFQEKLQQMEFYLSNKQLNVDLSETPVMTNPNLFLMG